MSGLYQPIGFFQYYHDIQYIIGFIGMSWLGALIKLNY